MIAFWNQWHAKALALLRMIIGFLIFWHGTQKLFGYPPSAEAQGPLPTLMLIAGVLEFLGGLFLFIGLFTRWTAFILSGMMAVAYFMVFFSKGFLPIVNQGELSVLYCFVFLYVFFAGPGAWSVDGKLKSSLQASSKTEGS
ncbi:MAG: DoxX family protein [Bacteroidota bacterium]